MTPPLHVRDHAGVREVLADRRFAVPPVPEGPHAVGGLGWLRRTTVRFAEGAAHDRRRAVVEGLLARLDPDDLQARARTRARATPAGTAPYVPVEVLAACLGVSHAALSQVVPAVRTVAAVYLTGAPADATAPADDAVAALVSLLPDGDPEEVAQRVALLVQSCEGTAGLIRGVLAVVDEFGLSGPGRPATEALVTEALRLTSPVPGTRRRALPGAVLAGQPVEEGAEVVLDFAAANRDPNVFSDPDRPALGDPAPGHLTFGYGRRACPASALATALACGVLDVLLEESAPGAPDGPSFATADDHT
ncbi:cytochrome P450 [Nocardiopsis sp. NPDC050513]|uniref:cytochrome P450 n=1 Tax=Nocardiopsis sp. NPDC050513 TaxID=3364338 RepID=UPI0037A376A8